MNTAGLIKKVFIAYTQFISALTQKPFIKQLLPISKEFLPPLLDQERPARQLAGGLGEV